MFTYNVKVYEDIGLYIEYDVDNETMYVTEFDGHGRSPVQIYDNVTFVNDKFYSPNHIPDFIFEYIEAEVSSEYRAWMNEQANKEILSDC